MTSSPPRWNRLMSEPEDEFSPDLAGMFNLAAVRFRDDRGYTYNLDEWIGRKSDHTAEEIKQIFIAIANDKTPEDHSLLIGRATQQCHHHVPQPQQPPHLPPPPPPPVQPAPPGPPPQQQQLIPVPQQQQQLPVLLPQQQPPASPPPNLQQQATTTATPRQGLDTSDEQSFTTPTQETPSPARSPTRAGPRSRPAERTPSPGPSTSTPAARSASASRRALTFSPEEQQQPLRQQQQQQQQQQRISPYMPPRVAVTQPPSQLPPPNSWQFRQARAAARNYQATRVEARQRFLAMAEARAPASVQGNQQQFAQWRQHHEAIFAALNPRPADIFSQQLLQPEVLAEASPWEQQYSAQMDRLLQEHPPILVSNPREAQHLYQPQAAQRGRRH